MPEPREVQPTPWRQRPGESARAYAAAWAYIEMGAGRSHSAVAAKLGTHDSQIARWSTRWDWVVRAEAFDAHLVTKAQKAIEEAAQRERQTWLDRAKVQNEKQYELGLLMQGKAAKMLTWPFTKTTLQDGRTVEAARWHIGNAGTIAVQGSKLCKDAVQQELGHGGGESEEELVVEEYPALPPGDVEKN